MRRAILAVTGLAASTTLLVVLKGGPSTIQAAQNPPPGSTGAPGVPAGAGPGRKAPPANASGTATGPVVTNDFGRVQVRVTMVRGRITDVTAVELPQEAAQSRARSESVDRRYSGTAGEAVARQSADLDTVSGATATSDSYRDSLAAAIDAAAAGAAAGGARD